MTETWHPFNTERLLLQEISEFNKGNKKQITFDYYEVGFFSIEGLQIHFNNKDSDTTKTNRRFCVKYHKSKGFGSKLLSLLKEDEPYYEIYAEQEGY